MRHRSAPDRVRLHRTLLAAVVGLAASCGDIAVRLGDPCEGDGQCDAEQMCIDSVCTTACEVDEECRRRGLGFYCRDNACTDDSVERPLLFVLEVGAEQRFEAPGAIVALPLPELRAGVSLDASDSVYLGEGAVAWTWRVADNPEALAVLLSSEGGARATVTTPRVFRDTPVALELEAVFPEGRRTLLLDITVRDSENEPPDVVIQAPAAAVSAGDVVSIDAAGTADPNGDGLALPFAWTQTEGPAVTLRDGSGDGSWRRVAYDAPAVAEESRQRFELTVRDDREPPGETTAVVSVRIVPGVVGCVAAADCDDDDPCTTDTCDVPTGDCSHAEVAGCCRADADCDDGDPCTRNTCGATGACAHPAEPGCCATAGDCADGDPCTADTCDAATGDCGYADVADCCRSHADCDDGDPCTTDTCDAATGACGHAAVADCCRAPGDCADGDPCTADTCDVATGECAYAVVAGCCRAEGDCDDGDACTADTCDAATGACGHAPVADCCRTDGDCDDGDACTTDTCDAATGDCGYAEVADCCRSHADCDDGDPCTRDTCDATGGCAHPAEPGCCALAADCDDGDPCTTDTCDPATGDCGHAEVAGCCRAHADCDDGDVCTTDACDAATGDCGHAEVAGCCRADGDCDDGDPCTTDTCDAATGDCGHAAVAGCCRTHGDCADGDPCTSDTCDAATGVCGHAPVADCCRTHADCDDGDPCTTDACDGDTGACGHTPLAGCCRTDADCVEPNTVCGAAGVCEPVVCNVPCPVLEGYTAACNEREHCEYAFDGATGDGATGWRRFDLPILVPAGAFPMGDPDAAPGAWQYPLHTVDIATAYWIDRYEVSAAAFAAFLDERGSNTCADGVPCVSLEVTHRSLDWQLGAAGAVVRSACQVTPGGPTSESCVEHPAAGITWYGAAEFCRWVGKRLCSESEYERAAKGTAHRTYPWGEAAPGPARANCVESDCGDGYVTSAPVWAFVEGASPVGCQNLAGNEWEWVEDDWHETFAVDGGHPTDGSAWIDSPRAATRVLRGGGWGHDAAGMRSTDRFYHPPRITSDFALGFRCCR